MTLSYRCSGCGMELQTTNADALNGIAIVPCSDLQEAVDFLGGFMGSASAYQKVESLRDRLRTALATSITNM
jgi:hypothetical protein